MSREELQRKYIELKLLEQQVSQMQQQLLALDNQRQILEKTLESIEELDSIKQDSDTFIPIGQGVFARGKIKDAKTLLVGVGANVAVMKSSIEAKSIVEKQIEEVKKMTQQFEVDIQKATIHGQALDEEMQELAKEQNN